MSEDKKLVKQRLEDMLNQAGEGSLAGTEQIVAVAILYEGGIAAPPPKEQLANLLVEQYKRPTWIPLNLSVQPGTTVLMRQMIEGEEVSEHAILDTRGSNSALATMLADEIDTLEGCSAIAFLGDSPALGRKFFAVVAK